MESILWWLTSWTGFFLITLVVLGYYILRNTIWRVPGSGIAYPKATFWKTYGIWLLVVFLVNFLRGSVGSLPLISNGLPAFLRGTPAAASTPSTPAAPDTDPLEANPGSRLNPFDNRGEDPRLTEAKKALSDYQTAKAKYDGQVAIATAPGADPDEVTTAQDLYTEALRLRADAMTKIAIARAAGSISFQNDPDELGTPPTVTTTPSGPVVRPGTPSSPSSTAKTRFGDVIATVGGKLRDGALYTEARTSEEWQKAGENGRIYDTVKAASVEDYTASTSKTIAAFKAARRAATTSPRVTATPALPIGGRIRVNVPGIGSFIGDVVSLTEVELPRSATPSVTTTVTVTLAGGYTKTGTIRSGQTLAVFPEP